MIFGRRTCFKRDVILQKACKWAVAAILSFNSSSYSSSTFIGPFEACGRSLAMESEKPMFQVENFDDEFVQKLVYDALVWCSLHGLVVGDKTYQVSCDHSQVPAF